MRLVLSIAVAATILAAAILAVAQPSALEETSTTPSEMDVDAQLDQALTHIYSQEYIEAREIVEGVLREDPDHYVAQYLMGLVQHFGEANFPRALYHLNRAETLLATQHGSEPEDPEVQRWHQRLLRQLAFTHGDLERYERKLEYMDRHNELYEPPLVAERAWPLMKLRRFSEARQVAREALDAGDPRQTEIALNALCAVEFEAGDDQASYEACSRAVEYARTLGQVNVVDLTNLAESSRSLFRLDEAERLLVDATQANVTWYGNPWLELGELYLRQGRFVEAVDALKQMGPYRAQRPPHVRNYDLNEARRVIAQLFILLGREEDALAVTWKAQLLHDRRGSISRDPNQDRAIIHLLDRQAQVLKAERLQEEAAGRWFGARLFAWGQATMRRALAWRSGREIANRLSEEHRLVGLLRIGRAEAGITPPWLVGDLAEVLGAGVMRQAVREARVADEREGAEGYYDAFLVDVASVAGDEEEVVRWGELALVHLGSSEALLRARVHARMADALWESGDPAAAFRHYSSAFQRDPGVFRRLGLAVPVRLHHQGVLGEDVADGLEDSPRFDAGDAGLSVLVQAEPSAATISMQLPDGAVLSTVIVSRQEGESDDDYIIRLIDEFQRSAFAPRVDLSQADANSLDGSNQVSRNPIQTLFGDGQP